MKTKEALLDTKHKLSISTIISCSVFSGDPDCLTPYLPYTPRLHTYTPSLQMPGSQR